MTSRANLVGVITNGTAVLGLGNIGPLAAKPVMEGKGCLFKKFAGIDVFDIELAENDPDKLIDMIAAMEPTLGGINLEDIKAPECFYIEQKLKERMNIPVFHDDQHGTAIISGAAMLNGLKVVGKKIDEIKVVCSGAGAAAISCLNLWCDLGVKRENITSATPRASSTSVVRAAWMKPRPVTPRNREAHAGRRHGRRRRLPRPVHRRRAQAGHGQEHGRQADDFALANPTPEIMPELVKEVARRHHRHRPFRLREPGQQRAVLPLHLPRCARCWRHAYHRRNEDGLRSRHRRTGRGRSDRRSGHGLPRPDLNFGPEYLIPKPFDPRLIVKIAPAVAQAAMDSGVATRPITDWDAYRAKLSEFVYHTGVGMRAIFQAARQAKGKRIIYAEGEDERVLRAVQVVIEEKFARPILIGRPEVILHRLEKANLRIRPEVDFDVVNPESDERYRECWRLTTS
jgi:malate dehydrogenase (oxaloacetate-decarboxylating)(NADP+)